MREQQIKSQLQLSPKKLPRCRTSSRSRLRHRNDDRRSSHAAPGGDGRRGTARGEWTRCVPPGGAAGDDQAPDPLPRSRRPCDRRKPKQRADGAPDPPDHSRRRIPPEGQHGREESGRSGRQEPRRRCHDREGLAGPHRHPRQRPHPARARVLERAGTGGGAEGQAETGLRGRATAGTAQLADSAGGVEEARRGARRARGVGRGKRGSPRPAPQLRSQRGRRGHPGRRPGAAPRGRSRHQAGPAPRSGLPERGATGGDSARGAEPAARQGGELAEPRRANPLQPTQAVTTARRQTPREPEG